MMCVEFVNFFYFLSNKRRNIEIYTVQIDSNNISVYVVNFSFFCQFYAKCPTIELSDHRSGLLYPDCKGRSHPLSIACKRVINSVCIHAFLIYILPVTECGNSTIAFNSYYHYINPFDFHTRLKLKQVTLRKVNQQTSLVKNR